MDNRRLYEDSIPSVYYLQVKPTIPAYSVVDHLSAYDQFLFDIIRVVTRSEYEMIGGSSHGILVYTVESAIQQAEEKNSMLITFFRFPSISKISVQVMHTIKSIQVGKNDSITLEFQTMGTLPISALEEEFRSLDTEAIPACDWKDSSPPIQQLVQCIAALNERYTPIVYEGPFSDKLLQSTFKTLLIHRITIPFDKLIRSVSFLSLHPSIIHIDVQTRYSVPPSISLPSSRHLREYNSQERMTSREYNSQERMTSREYNSQERMTSREYNSQERMTSRDDAAPLYRHGIHILFPPFPPSFTTTRRRPTHRPLRHGCGSKQLFLP